VDSALLFELGKPVGERRISSLRIGEDFPEQRLRIAQHEPGCDQCVRRDKIESAHGTRSAEPRGEAAPLAAEVERDAIISRSVDFLPFEDEITNILQSRRVLFNILSLS